MGAEKYVPELGQLVFGGPYGMFEMSEYAITMFKFLLWEIERVVSNRDRCVHWNRIEDPKIPGIEWHPYSSNEDSPNYGKPNFKFGEVEIQWYKYPGRGMSCNVDWSPNQWAEWFDKCLACIRAVGSEER